MSGRYERADTREHDIAGSVRQISGHPNQVFNLYDNEEFALGAIAFDTSRTRFYVNFTGTVSGWRQFSLT